MAVSDDQVNRWAQAPSESESERCENAISQTMDTLRSHFGNDVKFIRQGSHRNRTNIRIDSDVDLAVVHQNYHFPGLEFLSAVDRARHESEATPASYPFWQFKSDVQSVLANRFGADSVVRKNKCIFVKGNTNRVNADVVPAFLYQRYRAYNNLEVTGIAFSADKGGVINSFPEQHYANGVRKNDDTTRAYKAVVRILKHVRGELQDRKIITPDLMSSYFIECLVWNVPNPQFSGTTWRDDAKAVIKKVWNDMRDAKAANEYAEVSDLHYLLRGLRKPAQAEEFMLRAWSFLDS
jgi:hypothetical protein